jgi:hypothetical protein
MSAEVTHRNHHESHIAFGTGPHNHHRGRLERDGAAVGYSVCMMGTGPLRACPDEPDPEARLLVKLATAREARAAARMPARDRCRYGHAAEYQTRNRQGSAICVECRRLASMKARMKRSASAIVTAALAA